MMDSNRLIAALQSPAAYDHPVAGTIELIETHISWVLLAGDYAYKVKKPLKLPFVDFSTLAKRRHFCQEELRLNRRLAPRLYLDVVPIAGSLAQPKVNGEGPPWEYAVKMRKFPQEALLSVRLKQGRLTGQHIDEMARVAAKFHGRIAVADPASRWGDWDNVSRPIEENFAELLDAAASSDAWHSPLLMLQAWNRRKLAELRETILQRRQDGFVRECHGDMHLKNIVLLPREDSNVEAGEEVVIFDGIDFNENLRWIDVQNEIAFTVMDLDERGRSDLARRFLNVYLEATGDYEGLAVLRLYLNYRALVRAKVDWIRGHQPGVEDEQRRRLEEEFSRYLTWAERYAQPPRPRLFLTHGVSGSGKSHFARRLVETTGAVQMRSDVERKRLFLAGTAGESPNASEQPAVTQKELYSRRATDQTYARMEQLAATALAAGFSVIADATFLGQPRRDRFRRVAERAGAPWLILDFQAPPQILRERVLARQRQGVDASDADLQVLSLQLATYKPLAEDERPHALVIDASSPAAVDQALVSATRWAEE